MTVQILTGDCREVLKTLPSASVHCCVTSPPYFGLRDYGHESQIGLEPTPAEFVRAMVEVFREVFREVRRVLRDDGTLWLNLGDSYSGSRCGGNSDAITGKGADESVSAKRKLIASSRRDDAPMPRSDYRQPGLKPKDLIGIPWRVAFALQEDGWYLRQDIIWSKPNPMPESVTDRCTKSHEYLFLLSKSPQYYFDNVAIQEPLATSSIGRLSQDVDGQAGSDRVPGKSNGTMKAVYTKPYNGKATKDFQGVGVQDASATKARIVDRILSGEIAGRNKRSVWTVTTKPFKGAHFATFPPELIEPCIRAATSEEGCCSACGAPYQRQSESAIPVGNTGNTDSAYPAGMSANRLAMKRQAAREMGVEYTGARVTTGWAASCACEAAIKPCLVLDPFGGAGTTGLVADRLGRSAVLCELNPKYADMARARIRDESPLFAQVAA